MSEEGYLINKIKTIEDWVPCQKPGFKHKKSTGLIDKVQT